MKKLFVIIALLISATSFAQYSFIAPVVSYGAYELGGQLVNNANTNAKPVLDTVTTSSTASTIYLYTSIYAATGGNLFALSGTGSVSFTIVGTKISGTPAGSIALQGSIDGVQWGPVHEGTILSSDTLQVANQTTNSYAWSIGSKRFRYYRLCIIIPSSTQSTSWSGFWDFNKQYFYTSK